MNNECVHYYCRRRPAGLRGRPERHDDDRARLQKQTVGGRFLCVPVHEAARPRGVAQGAVQDRRRVRLAAAPPRAPSVPGRASPSQRVRRVIAVAVVVVDYDDEKEEEEEDVVVVVGDYCDDGDDLVVVVVVVVVVVACLTLACTPAIYTRCSLLGRGPGHFVGSAAQFGRGAGRCCCWCCCCC